MQVPEVRGQERARALAWIVLGPYDGEVYSESQYRTNTICYISEAGHHERRRGFRFDERRLAGRWHL